jgi:hypothetical protein
VIPRIAPPRDAAAANDQTSPRDQLLERLRQVVGPAGAEVADGVVEALRQELKREYERGYHDGWASVRPVNDGAITTLRRKARRGMRHWSKGRLELLKSLIKVVVIVALCAGAVMLSLRLTSASKDKKFAPPTITW